MFDLLELLPLPPLTVMAAALLLVLMDEAECRSDDFDLLILVRVPSLLIMNAPNLHVLVSWPSEAGMPSKQRSNQHFAI